MKTIQEINEFLLQRMGPHRTLHPVYLEIYEFINGPTQKASEPDIHIGPFGTLKQEEEIITREQGE